MAYYPLSFFTHENLCKVSRDYLLLALFPRSRSEAFKWAIDIAKNADLFAEEDLETMQVYVAGFVATKEGAEKAVDLMHYVRGWKGTHFYAQGRMAIGSMVNGMSLAATIQCFAASWAVKDVRAYCYRTIDDPCDPMSTVQHFTPYRYQPIHVEVKSKDGTYLFPCRHMLQWFRAQEHHPSSIRDQIQAEGVEKFCDACPRFDPNEFGLTSHKRPKLD